MTFKILQALPVLALTVCVGDGVAMDPSPTPKSTAQALASSGASSGAEVEEANVVAKMVNQNHDAALKALDQAEASDTPSGTPSRGPASVEEPRVISKVIVVNGANGYDPGAEDKIRAMNIPEKVKDEILRNYRKTGVMPNFETPH